MIISAYERDDVDRAGNALGKPGHVVIPALPLATLGFAGIVTTSRSSALTAKILSKCGARIAVEADVNSTLALKILSRMCAATRMCYLHHTKRTEDVEQLKKNVMKCIADTFLFLYFSKQDQYGKFLRPVRDVVEELKLCVGKDMPGEAVLALAMLRSIRSHVRMLGK
ncbi:uncharacterized protein [Dermacentor andersoni]|uniref:uncharacterized protein n=1 Tax=Dermacentor andersoni TaxID=34620 RepID=UPI003B3BAA71